MCRIKDAWRYPEKLQATEHNLPGHWIKVYLNVKTTLNSGSPKAKRTNQEELQQNIRSLVRSEMHVKMAPKSTILWGEQKAFGLLNRIVDLSNFNMLSWPNFKLLCLELSTVDLFRRGWETVRPFCSTDSKRLVWRQGCGIMKLYYFTANSTCPNKIFVRLAFFLFPPPPPPPPPTHTLRERKCRWYSLKTPHRAVLRYLGVHY